MRSTLILFLFVCPLLATAQNLVKKCHSNESLDQLLETNPEAFQKVEAAREQVARQMTLPQLHTRSEEVIIPVVIHVVYHASGENISDAQVKSQIDAMNRDFNKENGDVTKTPSVFQSVVADCNIRFQLATKDVQGNVTTGIVRHYSSNLTWGVSEDIKMPAKGGFAPWNPAKYLNIWVCNMGGRSIGFASFPGMPAEYDGIVIDYRAFGTTGTARYPYNMGRTCVHEIGHWLGLYHIWGDSQCGDDHIHDTPTQEAEHKGNPTFPQYSNCKNVKTIDMTMNYMEYVNDEAMFMFTNAQRDRMWTVLRSVRPTLMSSDGASRVETSTPTVSNNVKLNNVLVFPNPITDNATVKIDDSISAGTAIKVFDANGVVRIEKTINTATPSVSLNFFDLPSGFYWVSIQNDGLKVVKKVMKVRE